MEQCFDVAKTAVETLNKALSEYDKAREAIRQLSDYYESPLWRLDYESDEAGLLPPTLRRGILSEDALWDLLNEVKELDKRLEQENSPQQ